VPDPKALLVAMMQPSPNEEEEFNDWYDTEHMRDRGAHPGFLTALRFVCLEGWPRYLALYDLASIKALSEPEYIASSGANHSPWSKRVLARVHGIYRAEGVQLQPGDTITGEKGHGSRLVLWRFRGLAPEHEAHVARGLEQSYGSRPELLQYRLFRSAYEDVTHHLAVIELKAPVATESIDLKHFGPAAGHIDLINVYTRYWRHGRFHGMFTK
jgi:hypothetical protein